jgi:hypothetical protein
LLDACDKAGVFGSKKDDCLCNLIGMIHATERELGSWGGLQLFRLLPILTRASTPGASINLLSVTESDVAASV